VKTTLALRHVAFEDMGLLAPWLEPRGHTLRYAEAPTDDLAHLDPLEPDLLVVLGGPIGAYEEAQYPFLVEELRLLERRLAAGHPTLGLCLGAQLMARALGARVYPGKTKEIGWSALSLAPAGRESCLRHLEATPVLHWHGDTFDLPEGAVRLASTAITENQAFAWGGAALALQFHAEAAGAALERWFVGHALEIATTPGVSVESLRADTRACSPALERAGRACFEEWLASVGL
jgi:GMP synthase (glutamine-hydrolysing)